MSKDIQPLKPSETAALMLHVFGGENDWKIIYCIAAGWTKKDVQTNPNISSYYRRWKLSEKIQAELRRLELLKAHLLQEARLEGFEDGKKSMLGEGKTETELQMRLDEGRKKEAAAAIIDYTDPVQQKRKLNEIISNSEDDGDALDALKVIIQSQKNDTDAAKDKQVQRFYTPLQCRDCPLYQEAKEGMRKK